MNTQLKQYFRLLLKYLKTQKLKVVLLGIILGSSITLQLINPQVLRYFIDSASKGGSARALTIAAILFIGVALLQQLLIIVSTYMSQNIGWSATNELRLELLEHCLKLDMTFYKSHQPTEIIERVDGDVTALFNFFSKFIINIVNNIVLIIGILILLFREDYRVGVSLSAFAIFAIISLWNIQKRSVDKWVASRERSAKFFGSLGEDLGSTEDILSCGARAYIMNKFNGAIVSWFPIHKKAVKWHYLMWQSSLGIFAVGNIVAFGIGGYLWTKGIITIGTVFLIYNYTELLSRPIEQIRAQFEDLQKAGASVIRVQEIFNIKSEFRGDECEKLPDGALPIEFKNVLFEYETGVPVIRDISFKLEKGKVLGVLGRTGSGKTTMARMLARLYDPSEGEIYFGDKKLNSIGLKELRKHIAFVTQDVELFHATIRDNITFFDSEITDDEIVTTINSIGLTKWYEALDNGLDTMLSAGGSGLSSGEGQLLALVRVFLRNPGIVILDEASSRLDPITEQLMEKAISKLLENRTCIIIAHRLSTIERADNILILENGEILEYGDREKLSKDIESKLFSLLKTGVEVTEELQSA